MTRKLFLQGYLFFLLPTAVLGTPVVSLKTLVERSQNQHPESQLYMSRMHSTTAMQMETLTLPNPMLSYEQMTATGMSSMKETKWEFRQKIPFPVKTYFSYELLKKEMDSIAAEQEQNQRQRESQLAIEYFRWLSLNKLRNLKKEQEILLKQLIEVQRTRYVSQKVSQVEVVALQIERGNLMNELSRLEAELTSQKVKVEALAGPGTSLQQVEPVDEKVVVLELKVMDRELLAKKLEAANAELKALQLMAERGEALVSRSNAGWFPDLELMLTEKEDDQGTKRRGWQLGFEIPLWLAGEQRAKVNQARAESQSSQIRYQEQKRRLVLEAENLLSEHMQLRQQMELMENGLVQWSTQNVRSARTAYQTGSLDYASFLALIQSAYRTLEGYEEIKVRFIEKQEQIKLLFGGKV